MGKHQEVSLDRIEVPKTNGPIRASTEMSKIPPNISKQITGFHEARGDTAISIVRTLRQYDANARVIPCTTAFLVRYTNPSGYLCSSVDIVRGGIRIAAAMRRVNEQRMVIEYESCMLEA